MACLRKYFPQGSIIKRTHVAVLIKMPDTPQFEGLGFWVADEAVFKEPVEMGDMYFFFYNEDSYFPLKPLIRDEQHNRFTNTTHSVLSSEQMKELFFI